MNEIKKKQKKSPLLKTVALLINTTILIILFILFYNYGANPLIVVLILLFAFLTIAGPILAGKKKSYYSEMFPDKEEAHKRQRWQKEFVRSNVEPKIVVKKDIGPIDLNVNIKKPQKKLLVKCPYCGMLLTRFVKKCPNCRNVIMD